ncbi:MAG: endo alpha-1,4 polygalactosaminidase [Blautia sp.]|nr:endo alpha-1,4 polygalactosaminidase [Blautia sp.]
MALRYCFEQDKVKRTLEKCKKNDLAVIDTEGCESAVRSAVSRGVYVYGYLNAGALESERSYYGRFKHLRLAKYDGWDGEYWIDPTDMAWQQHLISEAKRMQSLGVIGLYLDNTDIYYMCAGGFKEERIKMIRKAPSPQSVYNALSSVVRKIDSLGMIVMPNGGDTFVRKFASAYPSVIKTVNQEGVLYQDNKKQSKEDTAYYTEYLDWCRSRGMYIRGIEYTKSKTASLKCKAYYVRHGWQGLYISKHKNLEGD